MTAVMPPHEWAELISAALAAGVDEPVDVVGERDRSGLVRLLPIVEPFVRVAGDRFLTAVASPRSGLDLAPVRLGFGRWLAHRLVRLAARTVVLELNIARVTGALPGESPTARFDSFVARAASRDGLTQLLADYPVLARLLGQACGNAVAAAAELCSRFREDRADIVATLLDADDPGLVDAIQLGAGDGHQRGRAVAMLRFVNGARVVYKPRPVTLHRHFNELLKWFDTVRHDRPALRRVRLVERPGYGWAEFIAWRPFRSDDELDRFYHRQGSLLALLHALAGTDFHAENLIAHGEDPVLVDVETLFHPTLERRAEPDDDPAARVWASSTHGTGILPMHLLGDEVARDVSGLGGDPTAMPHDAVDWEAAGTDQMRLVRRPGRTEGAQNRPVRDGVVVEPADYADHLLAGFRDGYDTIAAATADLVGPAGRLAWFADDEVRMVPRPTQLYATMLDESTHPDVLRDTAARNAVLAQLREDSDPVRAALVEYEIADLWAGDIPYFQSRPASRDVWTSTGHRIPDLLAEPMLDRVSAAIRAMGEDDRRTQEWIIRAALASRAEGDPHGVAPDSASLRAPATDVRRPGTRDRLLAVATDVADGLLASACRGPARTNWLGLELAGDRFWQVAPLGAGFGNGHCGPAVFLAQLARLTGETRYAEEARRTVAGMPRLLAQLDEHPDLGAVGSGGFAGLGSIAYALTHLAAWLDDTEIAGWVAAAVDLAVTAAVDDVEVGVVGGTAGGLATLIAVHQATGLASARAGAQLCADRLLAQSPPGEPSFVAGAAGFGWALLRYAAVAGGVVRYRETGLANLRAAWATVPPSRAWCRGLTGLALATLDVRAEAGDNDLTDRVASAVRLVHDSGALPNHSLCHGELGRLALLQAIGDEARPAAELAQALAQTGPRCGTPNHVSSPGLLTGLAGIGHGALRLAFPDDVPSLLMLQPAGRAPGTS